MASALADGWSDTGDTASFTLAGDIQLNAGGFGSSVAIGLRGNVADAEQVWSLSEDFYQSGADYISDLYVRPPGNPLFTTPVLVDSINHGPSPPAAATYFPAVSFSSTLGPYRLGTRFRSAVTSPPTDAPVGLADTCRLDLGWAESELTVFSEAVAGETQDFYPLGFAGLPPAGDTSRIVGVNVGEFRIIGARVTTGSSEPIALLTNVEINGALIDGNGIDDNPSLDPSYNSGGAPGEFNIVEPGGAGFPIRMAPGASITFANTFLDYAGGAVSPDVLDNWLTVEVIGFGSVPQTPQQAFVTNGTFTAPFFTNWLRSTKNPPSSILLSIAPAWLTANGWDPNDLAVVLDQPSPISGAASYSPIAITQKAAIEIDTPIGGRPSNWSINSGANGSVTQNPGDTSFVVSNVAARFTRNFATNWRSYTTGPQSSPEWQIDGYSFLRRHYGQEVRGVAQATYPEDYWWWNSYQFLRLNIDASANAVLTLTVRGIDLHVTDSHHSVASIRAAGLAFSLYDDVRIYRVSVTSGVADYWVDLSFPDSYVAAGGAGFPMRRPRVDSIELAFSATGTFILNACELSRRDSYATEVKVAYSPHSSYNGEWPGVYFRVDGEATPALTYGDTFAKGMEQELGGSIRFAEGITGTVITARAMWEQLARIEGFAVTYNDGARQAFHRDAYGVSLVTEASEPAQFAMETTPGAAFAGAGDAHSYSPPHCIRCGGVTFPNGMSVTIKGRHVFGGGVEAIACVGGMRAGAGVNIDVIDELNVTLSTEATDARGRVHFEPIGHGKIVRMEAA